MKGSIPAIPAAANASVTALPRTRLRCNKPEGTDGMDWMASGRCAYGSIVLNLLLPASVNTAWLCSIKPADIGNHSAQRLLYNKVSTYLVSFPPQQPKTTSKTIPCPVRWFVRLQQDPNDQAHAADPDSQIPLISVPASSNKDPDPAKSDPTCLNDCSSLHLSRNYCFV